MRDGIKYSVTGACIAITVLALIGLIVYLHNPTHKLNDDTGSVVCGIGFFHNWEEANRATTGTVKALEEVAARVCKEQYERTETDHRHPTGEAKHAVLLENSDVCIINWELTPAAHLASFIDVCANRNP